MNPPATNVLVSHRLPLVRCGLMAALSASQGLRVRASRADQPGDPQDDDVIVTDLPSALQRLVHRAAEGMTRAAPILAVVLETEFKTLARSRPMGVQGYASLATSGIDLIRGVEALAIGLPFCCPTLRMPLPREIASLPDCRAAHGGLAPAALRRVRVHIDAHLSRQLQLGELAAIARLSRGHFTRAFRQSMGIAPCRYIKLRRVAVASERIRGADLPLGQIALETGFANQSHFTRSFANQMGETPSEFRRRHR